MKRRKSNATFGSINLVVAACDPAGYMLRACTCPFILLDWLMCLDSREYCHLRRRYIGVRCTTWFLGVKRGVCRAWTAGWVLCVQ